MLMPNRKAIVLTAYDRPDLLDDTLESLRAVRGKEEWSMFISLDPSANPVIRRQVQEVATAFAANTVGQWREHGTPTVLRQYERQGVLRHPYRVFEDLFAAGYDYVLRLEDDMLFTEDLLEYHAWAASRFAGQTEVTFVESLADGAMHPDLPSVSTGKDAGPQDVMIYNGFNSPLAIGTWEDRWRGILRDTWDLDYSSGGDHDSGWDWNLSNRIYPFNDLKSVVPLTDKVWHSGVVGAHSTPDIYIMRERLKPVHKTPQYRVLLEVSA